ncbi:MAG: hypothetical protein H6Q72_289 [Firmicutes bacterium]|nr:hypothetical protein [Bacillota bacterium]
MIKSWQSFVLGAVIMLLAVLAMNMVYPVTEKQVIPETAIINTEDLANKVTITPLPTLRIIRGNQVPFEGKVELRQVFAGRAGRDITIVNFQAAGEHADKSLIKIVWENGEVEKLAPGTVNKTFSPDRRAVEIAVIGYSMHERPIFRDASRKGTLTWEIRYEPID